MVPCQVVFIVTDVSAKLAASISKVYDGRLKLKAPEKLEISE
jgi:hypothetical protein